LVDIVKELDQAIQETRNRKQGKPLTIAVMGCEVNGLGEAREADIGIAAGKGSGVLFIKGKVVKRVKEKDFVKEILKCAGLKA
jgi:(E)-4-hydroxy-3-methylbut-2-enyl-diphosphate synthase